jgi:hypothetical protein
MKPTVLTAITVILLSTITRNLGYLKSEVAELLSISLFVILLALCLPFGRRAGRPANALLAALLLALTLAFSASGQIARVVLVTVALTAVALDGEGARGKSGECASLSLASFAFGLYTLGIMHSDLLWRVTESLSNSFSHFVAGLASKDLLLSASASGFHLCVLILLVMLSAYVLSSRRSPLQLAAAFLAPVFLMGAFILVGAVWRIPARPGREVPDLSHFDIQILLVILGLAVIRLAAPTSKPRKIPALPRGRRLVLSVAAAGALCAGLALLVHPDPPGERGRTVLLYDRGHIVWRHPVFGWYGDKSGGMFGYLPRYLEFRGFEAKRDTISEETLKGVDLVVAINLAYPFTENEHRLTWGFVRDGGALLALGDHTGFNSIREPFNSLLEPVGIEFQFDSAKGFSESWVDEMEWRPHETTRVVRDENSTQIWTGASLRLKGDATPVVLGRHAWSDSGDAENAQRSYLGDFRYKQGELLGDVVLAAAAGYGKGKVLVFGDTSTFQNGALVQSDEFAHGCLSWLCTKDAGGAFKAIRLPLGVAFLAVAAAAAAFAGLSYLGVLLLSLSLLAAPLTVARTGWPPPMTGTDGEKVAYVDKSHCELFDLNSWNKDSIGGLVYNLMRNGFFPFVHRRFSEDRLAESDLLLVSGPTRDFSATEIDAIDKFVRSGKVLLVSMGNTQYRTAPSLLDHFDLSVRNLPLGRLETGGLGGPVRFYDAYPLECAAGDTAVICEGYGYPVAVMRAVGEGRVVAMGDSRFFQNKNLEDRDEYIEENIMFLKRLFDKLDREVLSR